ncbi:hypothetical protein F5146DRAFT_1149786 [Armillaria mellea]|nr:hypothetical protein F5146DRAFT_1149786 [Armillaria mellea]
MVSNSSPVTNEVKAESRRRSSKFSLTPGTEGAPLPSPMIERPGKPLFPSDVGLNGRRRDTEISVLPSLPHSEESSLSSDAPTRSVSARRLHLFAAESLEYPLHFSAFYAHALRVEKDAIGGYKSYISQMRLPPANSIPNPPIGTLFYPHLVTQFYPCRLIRNTLLQYMACARGGLVAYAFDPLAPDLEVDDDDDKTLNDPKVDRLSPRGMANVAALIALLIAIISLFVVYPIAEDTIPQSRHGVRSQVPFRNLISSYDISLGQDAVTKPGEYTLIFKDEFDRDNRPLINGNDPVWHTTVYSKIFLRGFSKPPCTRWVSGRSSSSQTCLHEVRRISRDFVRYPDDHDIKKFAWYAESEVPSWLGLTIDLGGDDRRSKEQAIGSNM